MLEKDGQMIAEFYSWNLSARWFELPTRIDWWKSRRFGVCQIGGEIERQLV